MLKNPFTTFLYGNENLKNRAFDVKQIMYLNGLRRRVNNKKSYTPVRSKTS